VQDLSIDTVYSPRKDKLKNFLFWGLIAVYVATALLPLLRSGYYSDDMVNSLLRPQIELDGESFLKHFLITNSYWITTNGRFFPASLFLTELVYYYATNLLAYKIIILILVIADVVLFGHFVRMMTDNKYLSYLLMLVIPSFFQFRLYHDPILAFGGLLQIILLLLLLSLIFLQYFLNKNKYAFLVASLVFYNISLYSYEVCLAVLPAYLYLIFENRRKFKRSLIDASPFLISFLIALTLNLLGTLVWKNDSGTGYVGTKANLDIALLAKTFFLQSGAALPLSYYFGNPSKIFDHSLLGLLLHLRLLHVFIAMIFTAAYVNFSKKMQLDIRWKNLVIIGLVFFLFPAFLIALSAKYQAELARYGFGMGYLPVYIEYYGFLLLVAGCLFGGARHIGNATVKKAIGIFVLVALNYILLVNLSDNSIIVDKANIDLSYRRTALEGALEGNLLQAVPENSRILICDEYSYDPYPPYVVSDFKGWANGGYHWKDRALVYGYSGKKVAVYTSVGELLAGSDLRGGRVDYSGENVYMIIIASYPEELHVERGYIIFGKIKDILINKTDINKSQVELENKKFVISQKNKL
jgi:hypothetical protein